MWGSPTNLLMTLMANYQTNIITASPPPPCNAGKRMKVHFPESYSPYGSKLNATMSTCLRCGRRKSSQYSGEKLHANMKQTGLPTSAASRQSKPIPEWRTAKITESQDHSFPGACILASFINNSSGLLEFLMPGLLKVVCVFTSLY
jgi:hypothetical protein